MKERKMEEFFKPKDWNGEFDPRGSICREINNRGERKPLTILLLYFYYYYTTHPLLLAMIKEQKMFSGYLKEFYLHSSFIDGYW